MQEQILEELDNTRSRLITAFTRFKNEEINIIPFEGSWTAAQLVEHILRSLKGVLKTLHGPVRETKRDPAAKVPMIRQTFLNLSTKFVAPDFLMPSNLHANQEELVKSLEAKMKEISNAVHEVNLSETCLGHELPGAGAMTRLEWIYFVIYHSQRHTQQLENIFGRVSVE